MSSHPTVKEKFEKAVNVIRNLPKNGSFQPSYDLQLKFYAYFKQATEGTNHHPKPSFWEVVKKAKWDAWTKLGNMTKEEAMTHYVDELRRIVETMSYTDNVATFLNSLDSFYENVPAEDLELLIGPIIDRVRSRPDSPLSGSPLASRDTSPSRATGVSRDESPIRLNANNAHAQKHITSSLETSPASSYSASPLPPDTEEEDEEEHFLDTEMEPDRGLSQSQKNRTDGSTGNNDQSKEFCGSKDFLHPHSTGNQGHRGNSARASGSSKALDTAQSSIATIRKDMDCLQGRILSLESTVLHKQNQINNSLAESSRTTAQSNHVHPTSLGVPLEFIETIRNTIEKMTREMENLQRRMAAMENRRQPEVSQNRKKNGSIRWGLSLQATTVILTWPIFILLLSKWFSNRRQR